MIYHALCESKLIEKSNVNVYMPRQQLTFAEAKLTWRETEEDQAILNKLRKPVIRNK